MAKSSKALIRDFIGKLIRFSDSTWQKTKYFMTCCCIREDEEGNGYVQLGDGTPCLHIDSNAETKVLPNGDLKITTKDVSFTLDFSVLDALFPNATPVETGHVELAGSVVVVGNNNDYNPEAFNNNIIPCFC